MQCVKVSELSYHEESDSTIARPSSKPAIFFIERIAAARHKEGFYRKKSIHMFSCVQRSIDR